MNEYNHQYPQRQQFIFLKHDLYFLTSCLLLLTLLVASPSHAKGTVEAPPKDEVTTLKKNLIKQPATTKPSSSTGTPIVTLKPYTAELKGSIKGLPMKASGNRELKQNNKGEWELQFDADAGIFGISESSAFQFDNGFIKPGSYHHKRSGLIGKKLEEQALFDWKQSLVNWKNEDKQWAIKLQNGALDNLSYQTQLRMDLIAGKKELSYLIAKNNEIYRRDFTIEGEEIVETDAGKLKTVKVKVKRDNNERQTYIWFAKDWDYFFVKLLQIKGSSEYTVEIKSASIDGKPIKGI